MTRLNRFTGSFLARLAVGYVLVAAVFAAAWLWSLYGPLTRAAIRQQQSNLIAVAQSAALVASESSATAEEISQQLVSRTDLRLTIIGHDGVVVADSNFDPAGMENHRTRPEVSAALSGTVGADRRVSRTEGIEELYVAVPATLSGQKVVVRVSQPLAEIEEIAARSRRVGLLLLGTALLFASAVAWWATRNAAQPVEELSCAAERMADGDLGAQVPDVPTDLQGLATSLAALRDQIKARLDALEAEKRTLSATLDGLGDAVFVFERRTVQLANTAADAMFGVPAGGWRGTDLDDIAYPAVLASVIKEHLDGQARVSVEVTVDPSGQAYRTLIVPIGTDAADGRTIVAVSDVTERSRLDRVRRDFVANASHELKTPVAGIRLLAQTVESAAGDGEIDQALEFARQIETETARLQRLVSDLLDLSRLESIPAADSMTDVRRVVDNATVSHRSAAADKGLELNVDLGAIEGHDVFASADQTDVAIALDNLLDNAIAYTSHGRVDVSVRADVTTIEIDVSDTGPGISSEHQPRVFERFYRVDTGRTRASGGTGLGLALVKHVAERNGGAIALRSEPGAGSTFTLTLPRLV